MSSCRNSSRNPKSDLFFVEVLYGSELYPDAPTFQHFYPEPKLNPVTKKPVSPDTMLDRLAVMDAWGDERRKALQIRAERKRDSKRVSV